MSGQPRSRFWDPHISKTRYASNFHAVFAGLCLYTCSPFFHISGMARCTYCAEIALVSWCVAGDRLAKPFIQVMSGIHLPMCKCALLFRIVGTARCNEIWRVFRDLLAMRFTQATDGLYLLVYCDCAVCSVHSPFPYLRNG